MLQTRQTATFRLTKHWTKGTAMQRLWRAKRLTMRPKAPSVRTWWRT